MQTTQLSQTEETTINQVVILLGVGVAILLFALIIGRMGLLNRIIGSRIDTTAVGLLLSAEAMRFGMDEMHVAAGEAVTLTLDNHDLYAHSFDIDELNVHIEMSTGQVTAVFTPDKPGTYQFYCAIPGHKEAGMVGTLIVQ